MNRMKNTSSLFTAAFEEATKDFAKEMGGKTMRRNDRVNVFKTANMLSKFIAFINSKKITISKAGKV